VIGAVQTGISGMSGETSTVCRRADLSPGMAAVERCVLGMAETSV
jgi:hypothetical protein